MEHRLASENRQFGVSRMPAVGALGIADAPLKTSDRQGPGILSLRGADAVEGITEPAGDRFSAVVADRQEHRHQTGSDQEHGDDPAPR